jgi:hypothetical protein
MAGNVPFLLKPEGNNSVLAVQRWQYFLLKQQWTIRSQDRRGDNQIPGLREFVWVILGVGSVRKLCMA